MYTIQGKMVIAEQKKAKKKSNSSTDKKMGKKKDAKETPIPETRAPKHFTALCKEESC
jgi:hypothetical protein